MSPGRAGVAILLLAAFLGSLFVSSHPLVHHALHHDQSHAPHHCLACTLTDGPLEVAVTSVAVAERAAVAWYPHFLYVAPVSVREFLIAAPRGPPVQS